MPHRYGFGVPDTQQTPEDDVEAVLASTRDIGGLIARTLALLEPSVTMPQWRVIVLASDGGCNITTIAADLGIHPSNATRLCDRLVRQGLLERRRADQDRRQVLVTLTEEGQRFHRDAMELRRRAVTRAMESMVAEDRKALAAALPTFAAALTAGAR